MATMTKPDCAKCGSAMEKRELEDGGSIWGCTRYPECKHAIRAATPSEIRRARKILKNPLVAGPSSVKLLGLLDKAPHRVIPLVLGKETPSGAKTVQALMFERRRNGGRARPQGRRQASTEGLRLYGEADDVESPSVIHIPAEGGPTIPGSRFPYHRCPYPSLNPIQSAAFPYLDKNVNVVVAASTSAGKTFTAEGFMADALDRGGKAAFLSPLKAVSAEKHEEWSSDDHPWSQRRVSIITGDFGLTESRKGELKRAEVIVMTSEMLDSKTRRMQSEKNSWLNKILTLVVDEAHLLTMDGRGDALESGLMRFSRQNPHARIVLLSATMPNVSQLAEWLTHLNGKKSVTIESRWRPTALNVHWTPYEAHSGWGSYQKNEEEKRAVMLDLVAQHHRDKWIVFVHSKKAGRAFLEDVTEMGEEAVFHNADLDRKQRQALEREFKSGDLRIVIATSTLAWGINMPARRVGVLGLHRGMEEVDPIDVTQMAGRAGRTDWGAEGDAYILVPQEGNPYRYQEMIARYSNIGDIESVMNEEDTLAFHLCAEVAERGVQTVPEAVSWHDRSLAAFQGRPISQERRAHGDHGSTVKGAPDVLDRLLRFGILKMNRQERYEATELGRVASWLYFSPYDVAGWAQNFQELLERDRLYDDDCLAWALGAIKTSFGEYLPRELDGEMANLTFGLKNKGFDKLRLPPTSLALFGCLKGQTYKAIVGRQRGIQRDAPRVLSAIELIDKRVIQGLGQDYISALGARIAYGCTWTEAELCRLPGVGGKKASMLVNEGYDSIEKVLEAGKKTMQAVLGPKTGAKAWSGAKRLIDGEE